MIAVRLPLLLLALAYAALGARPALAAAAVLSFVLPAFIKSAPRLFDTIVAAIAVALAATFAFTAKASPNFFGASSGSSLHEAIAMGALVATGIRARFNNPHGGHGASIALALAGVMALGAAKPGWAYPGIAALFIVLSVVALRSLDSARPRLRQMDRRRLALATTAVALAAAVSIALAMTLPLAHDRAQNLAARMLRHGETRQAGFSGAISLGDLTTIINSDGLALRVYGTHVDHLRGIVYTRYGGGRWFARIGAKAEPVEYRRDVDRGPVIIEHVGAPSDRWFVPLGVGDLAAETTVRVDPTGVYTPNEDTEVRRVGFDPSDRSMTVAPPDEDDLAVPTDIRESLTAIALSWTNGATTAAARAAAVKRRLSSYTYALSTPPRPEGRDPILAFLVDHKTGHCEYFASALALLSRTRGIPSRVVGGYRVVERNEFTDTWAVRNRNAHAWVELWIDERWVTYDPTPPSGLAEHMPTRSAGFDAFTDALRAIVDRIGQWLLARIRWVAPLLVIGAILFLFRREILAGLRKRPVAKVVETSLSYTAAHAGYIALELQLAERGFRRAPSETLEDYASRLERESAVTGAANVVRTYAAARYGALPLPDDYDLI